MVVRVEGREVMVEMMAPIVKVVEVTVCSGEKVL